MIWAIVGLAAMIFLVVAVGLMAEHWDDPPC